MKSLDQMTFWIVLWVKTRLNCHCVFLCRLPCFFLHVAAILLNFSDKNWRRKTKKKVPNRRFVWLQLMILSSMGIEICRKMSVSTSLGGVSSSVKLILKATSGTPPQSSLSQKQLTVCPLRTPAIWGVGGEFGEPVQGSARVFLFHSNHFPSSCLDLHFTCNFWGIHIFPACVFSSKNHDERTEAPRTSQWTKRETNRCKVCLMLCFGSTPERDIFSKTQRPGELLTNLS